MPDMRMISLGHYLKEHWREFWLAAALGIAVPLIGSVWLRDPAWLCAVLRVRNMQLLSGLALAACALLLVFWSRTVTFWRRYRHTQTL
ncbi:MAG TPA: hypothetical protein VIH59_19520, partial [Candidatus Tectomicrobia bacterium]